MAGRRSRSKLAVKRPSSNKVWNVAAAVLNDPIGTAAVLHEKAVDTLAKAFGGDEEAIAKSTATATEIGVGLLGPKSGTGLASGTEPQGSDRAPDRPELPSGSHEPDVGDA